MIYISKRNVEASLGEALVIEIDPQKINYNIFGWRSFSKLKKKIKKTSIITKSSKLLLLHAIQMWENFLILPEKFGTPQAITKSPKYEKVLDLIDNIDSLDKTLWRKSLLFELANKGFAKHKIFVCKVLKT